MCGGGGGFLGNVVDSVVGTVSQPFENLGTALEKVVTDPTSLTLGDAVTLTVPIAGGLVRDAIDNPDHAAVQAAVVLGGAAATGGFASGAASVPGFAAPGSILPPAAEILATPVGASLVPAAAPLAASGGSGFLSTLGATSLAQTLTGLGQKAQGMIAAIPGATSFLPGLTQTARAAEAPRGLNVALGPNEAAPIPTPNDTLRSLVIGTAVVAIPLGGVAYFGWRAYRRWKS